MQEGYDVFKNDFKSYPHLRNYYHEFVRHSGRGAGELADSYHGRHMEEFVSRRYIGEQGTINQMKSLVDALVGRWLKCMGSG